jgi:hypothetical protein
MIFRPTNTQACINRSILQGDDGRGVSMEGHDTLHVPATSIPATTGGARPIPDIVPIKTDRSNTSGCIENGVGELVAS